MNLFYFIDKSTNIFIQTLLYITSRANTSHRLKRVQYMYLFNQIFPYLRPIKYSNFNISNHRLLKRHSLETMFRCKFNTAVWISIKEITAFGEIIVHKQFLVLCKNHNVLVLQDSEIRFQYYNKLYKHNRK